MLKIRYSLYSECKREVLVCLKLSNFFAKVFLYITFSKVDVPVINERAVHLIYVPRRISWFSNTWMPELLRKFVHVDNGVPLLLPVPLSQHHQVPRASERVSE